MDKKLVKIYLGTDCIKVHPRKPPGGRSTDVNDYPVGKAAYAQVGHRYSPRVDHRCSTPGSHR